MTRETINRIAILIGFLLSLLSFLIAVATGSDLSVVIIERSFIVFAISALLIWTALTIINFVDAGAARDSTPVRQGNAPEDQAEASPENYLSPVKAPRKACGEPISKGQNLDLIPAPQEDIFGRSNTIEGEESPEIKELEPFKPGKIDTDKGTGTQ
ncbi:MAG: hypothetical protein IBX64_07565 [Actinobacteria bacterium]|nr:hypothetical protein [Actinomycetota bacterium]